MQTPKCYVLFCFPECPTFLSIYSILELKDGLLIEDKRLLDCIYPQTLLPTRGLIVLSITTYNDRMGSQPWILARHMGIRLCVRKWKNTSMVINIHN